MNTRSLAFWLAALASGALPLLGCGGGGHGGSETAGPGDKAITTSSITKPAFIAKADSICRQGKVGMYKSLEKYETEHGELDHNHVGAPVIKLILIPSLKVQFEEVRALGAPEGEAEQVEEILENLERAASRAIAENAAGGEELNRIFKSAGRQALRYGFQGCAYGAAA